jgi:SAM-dependent methyltransferase
MSETDALGGVGPLRAMFNRTLKPPYVFARGQVTRALERRAGIETEGHFSPEELGLSAENQQRYQPSNWLALRRVLPPNEVTHDDVFIDFGSGMGRIVFQAAARYPFRRVIGIELSDRLHAVAERNIARNRDRLRCQDVRLVLGDALEYDLPDDVTVVYFGNPFTGPIFDTVVRKLVASVERNPRTLRVLYFNPVEERLLVTVGFRPVKRLRGMRPTAEWSRANSMMMYEFKP